MNSPAVRPHFGARATDKQHTATFIYIMTHSQTPIICIVSW